MQPLSAENRCTAAFFRLTVRGICGNFFEHTAVRCAKGNYRSGHNGAVLKTGGHFGSRFSIFPVFSTGRGCKKLRENRDFSPSFSPFSEKRWSGNTFGDVPKRLKGPVLKTGEYFGSRFSISPVFSTGCGDKKLRENRDFSPSFSPFSEKRWSGNTFGDVPKRLKGTVLKTVRSA